MLTLSTTVAAQPLRVESPGGTHAVTLALDEAGALTYAVDRRGVPLVTPSRLGVRLGDGRRLDSGLRVVGVDSAAHDETWETVWGERQFVRDHHRELRATVEAAGGLRMVVAVRAYEDGVAFRYEWPEQPGLDAFEIADEVTEFDFHEAPLAWWIPAYGRERLEYLHRRTTLAEAGAFVPDANADPVVPPHPSRPMRAVHTPLTLEVPGGPVVAVHEAALVDYASMTLEVTGARGLKADLVPWSTGVKVYARAPHVSPWRVLIVGDTPGDLAESDLVLNLNEPSRIEDTGWIEPQRYVGIWWGMHIGTMTWHSGPEHGATTENARRYIDFAAEHGFGGVLVEGWNTGWDGGWIGPQASFSFTDPYPDFDLEGVAAYARERGVRLIGHHETGGDVPEYEAQLGAAMALYERLGVRAVKTGYVSWGQGIPRTRGPGLAPGDTAYEWHHGQYMVRHHARVVEAAARHRVMVNVHEPVKGTGLWRTWPNLMSREGGRGMEYNAWSGDGGNPPEHETVLPFARMLSGPFDFTPGIVRLDLPTNDRNRVNTTLAKQLALYVVLYSPLQMAADLPANYAAAPEALRWISQVPVDWAESRVLYGTIGDAVAIARRDRASRDWYVGAAADEHERHIDLALDFLDAGTPYVAEAWADAPDAHWRRNPHAMTTARGVVDAGTVLPARLAPGGGLALRLRPATPEEAADLAPLAL